MFFLSHPFRSVMLQGREGLGRWNVASDVVYGSELHKSSVREVTKRLDHVRVAPGTCTTAPNNGGHVSVNMTPRPCTCVLGPKSKPKTLVVNTARMDLRIRSPPSRGHLKPFSKSHHRLTKEHQRLPETRGSLKKNVLNCAAVINMHADCSLSLHLACLDRASALMRPWRCLLTCLNASTSSESHLYVPRSPSSCRLVTDSTARQHFPCWVRSPACHVALVLSRVVG